MGGATGAARDNQMASLIQTYLPRASTRGGAALVASDDTDATPAPAAPVKAIAAAMLPKRDAPTPDPKPVAVAEASTEVADTSVDTASAKAATVSAYAEASEVDPLPTASVSAGSWVVQVASSPKRDDAKAFLERATKEAPRVLADASGFTVAFEKGGVTYYRARFGGFGSQNAALNACKALKKKKIDCYAVQQ